MMKSQTRGRLDQVLSMLPQIEQDIKGQTKQVLMAIRKEKEPCKPAHIASITGLKGPSVRRIIGELVRKGLVTSHPTNKYKAKG